MNLLDHSKGVLHGLTASFSIAYKEGRPSAFGTAGEGIHGHGPLRVQGHMPVCALLSQEIVHLFLIG